MINDKLNYDKLCDKLW